MQIGRVPPSRRLSRGPCVFSRAAVCPGQIYVRGRVRRDDREYARAAFGSRSGELHPVCKLEFGGSLRGDCVLFERGMSLLMMRIRGIH